MIRPLSALALVALTTGCFKPYDDLAPLDLSEVAYDNPLLTVDDAVVQTTDTSLVCPDGEPARIVSVYRTGLTEPQPVAVVLHGGAFDALEQDEAEEGEAQPEPTTYRTTSRLTRSWSISKVWETLGASTTSVDPGELHLGALPAALTNAGVIQIYPANCWGDLWHGAATLDADGAPLEDEDGALIRDGYTLAEWSVRLLIEGDFAQSEGFNIPQADAGRLHLVGLGDGGRGVGELLATNGLPPFTSVVVDSAPDQLGPWLTDPDAWPDEVGVVESIYGSTDPGVVDGANLLEAVQTGLAPSRTGFAWSSIDPQVPTATAAATAAAVAGASAESWSWDASTATHVQLNGDLARAEQVAAWMVEGTLPDLDTTDP